MEKLLSEIRKCTICEQDLPRGANPIVHVNKKSKILIIGQAPGTRVHETNISWNDPSGKRLREWLAVDDETFYNPDLFGIMAMGFCYPGRGKSGDLPPMKICAPTWHPKLLDGFTGVELVILIGQYSQNYYLKEGVKRTLTERVKNYTDYLPKYFTLPHPSPRNAIWRKKNPWFEEIVVPDLQQKVETILKGKN